VGATRQVEKYICDDCGETESEFKVEWYHILIRSGFVGEPSKLKVADIYLCGDCSVKYKIVYKFLLSKDK